MTDDTLSLGERASMDHWYPRLAELDVPTPKTAQISCDVPDDEDVIPVGRPPIEAVVAAIDAVGGAPAFARTDQTSAKHQFEDGARLDSTDEREINAAIARLRDRHGMAFCMPAPESYYIREFLELEHAYTAFRGTPIAAEIRVFLHDGDLHDYGFYWPKDAIRRPDTENWEELHDQIRAQALGQAPQAFEHADVVADEFDEGYWSCDFALADDGTWYCIDMAPGEVSWHPDTVERLVEDPRGVP